ncbi:MAG: hypothetical protein H6702_01600 [Myxococcales bacterium]|nr:hypothetical protein [Myxococcales bacterium]
MNTAAARRHGKPCGLTRSVTDGTGAVALGRDRPGALAASTWITVAGRSSLVMRTLAVSCTDGDTATARVGGNTTASVGGSSSGSPVERVTACTGSPPAGGSGASSARTVGTNPSGCSSTRVSRSTS